VEPGAAVLQYAHVLPTMLCDHLAASFALKFGVLQLSVYGLAGYKSIVFCKISPAIGKNAARCPFACPARSGIL
jgi:hypothetical protein